VHRAAGDFTVGATTYPAGSYVVKAAQAFRPHVLDMFEPQRHPDDLAFPGGAPTRPYDSAGWTLAFQMGVKFDRVLDAFDGPFERVDAVTPPARAVAGPPAPAGYLLSHHQNDAFIAVNRLLQAGEAVYWLRDRSVGGLPNGTGAIYVAASRPAAAILEAAAAELGVTVSGVSAPPGGEGLKLRPVRIGLWDRYGGASTSGWTRWILERYEFPFERVYAQALDAGGLAERFDVLILTDEAVIGPAPPTSGDVPAAYRHTTGAISRGRTVPALEAFVAGGGTLLMVGDSTGLAGSIGVRVAAAPVGTRPDGVTRALEREAYYVPGSILRVTVDNTTPLGYGFEPEVDVFFDNSPVFTAPGAGADPDLQPVAWFDEATPLRSGWAWGQHHLEGTLAVVDARHGRGRVLLFGPEITFRAQPHGTFKFLFNGIHYARAEAVSRVAR
jgi:hypothetical protein